VRGVLRAIRGYAFTIAGIAIGVAGLVALGAMAERIVRFIEGGDRFVLGQISVAGKGMGMGTGFTAGGMLNAATVKAIAAVDGVSAVQAQVMLPLNPSTSQFLTLTQELILGVDLAVPSPNRYYPSFPVRAGRFLRDGDRRRAVVGASFAASHRLSVGSPLVLDDQPYEVVGVLERMLTAPDRFVIVPIADARDQWVAKDRMLRTVLASGAAALTAADLNTGAAVGWRDGVDPDVLARRIQAEVSGVNVQLPSELSALLRSSTAFFSALLLGMAVLALVIGGLSLANTVAAAVFERIRDFGVKRALGASDAQLGGEVLGEALAVTLAGGVGGIVLAMDSSSSSSRRGCSGGR
jgi:putative ABC transport system permease protein